MTAGVRSEHITLRGCREVLVRRRGIALGTLAATLLVAVVYCVTAPRRYVGAARVQVEKVDSGAWLGLKGGGAGSKDNPGGVADALDYATTVQTEVRLLRSETTLLRVIHDLKMEENEDLLPGKEAAGWLRLWRPKVEAAAVPLESAPNRRAALLARFARRLDVEAIAGTRLIEIRYYDRDPARAAAVVNALIEAARAAKANARHQAVEQVTTWLGGQLEQLKRRSEELQARATSLQHETGGFGRDEAHNVVLARLAEWNTALATAEQNRMAKGAVARAAASANPELLAGLGGSGGSSADGGNVNSFAALRALRAQESGLEGELQQEGVRHGSAYPRVIELSAKLEETRRQIAEERGRIVERADSDYKVAASAEAAARKAFEAQKATADRSNDKSTAFLLARQEAEESRSLYANLLGALTQAGMQQGLDSTDMTVIDPARVPPGNAPSTPRVKLILAGALGFGLMLGAGAAFVREALDPSVQSAAQLEARAEVVGWLPRLAPLGRSLGSEAGYWHLRESRASEVVALPLLSAPGSAYSEAMRKLRTTLLAPGGQRVRSLLVTSAMAGDGKSLASLNLAVSLAQTGARTLLVNADLRRPRLDELLGLQGARGLSEALQSHCSPTRIRPLGALRQLSFVAGGRVPATPAELLGSEQMRVLLQGWQDHYDYLVIDSAPVMAVADPLLLAAWVDGCLLVVRQGETPRAAVEESCAALARHLRADAAFGIVLNAVAADCTYVTMGRSRTPERSRILDA